MTRRLWLHIGSHKTGTTTVQDTFVANKTLLEKRGLSVVHGSREAHLHEYLSIIEPEAFLPQGYAVSHPVNFAEHLSGAPCDTVFGSSENFAFIFQQSLIDRLAEAVRARFDEVRILTYLRRQDRHAVSHHLEGARAERQPEAELWGQALTALPAPGPQHRLYLDYDQRIRLWENAFGSENVTVRVFDRTVLTDGDIVTDVLAQLGLPVEGMKRLPDQNQPLGRLQAMVGRIAKTAVRDDMLTEALLEAMPEQDVRMMPAAAEARAFLEPYRDSNRRLNQRLGISALPDLFNDDFSDFPETGTDHLTEADCVAAIRAVIIAMDLRRTALKALSPDDFREASKALRDSHPTSALRLIEAAFSLRRRGPNIIKMMTELRTRLGKPTDIS